MDKCGYVKSDMGFCGSIHFISDGKTTEPTHFDRRKFCLTKSEADFSHPMLLHFDNLMCSGDWEYPDLRYLTKDLWNEVFEVEYSLWFRV